MNNIRRKRVKNIIKELGLLEEQMETAFSNLEELKTEEEEARDSIPENLTDSMRYENAEMACDNLDSAYSELEALKSQIADIITYLEECIG